MYNLENEPSYRIRQIKEALFNPKIKSWEDVFVLPKTLREKFKKESPWISAREENLKVSGDGSKKAVLKLQDSNSIETVLMKNARGEWTVCLSAQAGCPIGCAFCSTGKAGLKRNLTKEEIADQFRFWMWQNLRITNVVFMGMGEPFLNYENVRDATKDIMEYAGIGQNHIVISTIGVLDRLNFLLDDPLWPNVRLAISLHSAKEETRKKLIPFHKENFYDELIKWVKAYQKKLASNNRYLSFEYVLLKGVNDSAEEARELVKFLGRAGKAKVNLIPYNIPADGMAFMPTSRADDEAFQNIIKKAGFACTIRKSYGADIFGACGQLQSKN